MGKDSIRTLFLAVIIGFMSSSCAATKTNQCREIIEIANETVTEARTLTNGGQSSDPEAALLAADTMELAAEEMANLEITDEQLKQYQKDFMILYQDTARATRAFVKAYEKTDQRKLKQARKRLQKATAPESKLVTKINRYCVK
ncbi:hypothetical protein PCC7418_0507 [Halothece sp. PCC 7418]|uniref:hypothetical protein n=1 Tax=Halothece sp. (strain PCC 7418) TaxID=65093 RepID=UPI0002A07D84|nr:hypothetical protein [Halothece sp. PCC 7418]AFZ42736.1 hypothetical protein PCC7418_0507 [Halothece sp. PCC 7418]